MSKMVMFCTHTYCIDIVFMMAVHDDMRCDIDCDVIGSDVTDIIPSYHS